MPLPLILGACVVTDLGALLSAVSQLAEAEDAAVEVKSIEAETKLLEAQSISGEATTCHHGI